MSEQTHDDVRWLGDDEQRVWRELVAVMQLLPGALDRQLQAEAGVSHTYYMILAMLSEAPERSMQMSALAKIVSASQSRLTHAVSRLEERGWVTRTQGGQDKRVQIATLSDAGLDVLTRLAPGHVSEVRRRIFDVLSPEQVTALGRILADITAGLTGEAGTPELGCAGSTSISEPA